ncbi:hypothetical protein [Rhizobium sp. Leaf383]|uniref:hypothetical protein n=1 Tax=Rhizobium sp. Leaf383 TaxID=1736357 RepID=UPI0007136396|nr:hypothetical protein [Rhizobium sp. Leaf383]KQS86935.1 hypothetical protein ASG58_01420 [Rhizobium sp. Leaf383]
MDFSQTIEAQIASRVVRKSRLLELLFASARIGLWNGYGRLRTQDGKIWLGVGGAGRINGVAQSIKGSAPELKFTLSGVDETFASKAKGEAGEYYDRAAIVYDQFFDENWQCLDLPYATSFGLMRKLTSSRSSDGDGFTRTVSISAETPFAGKKRARFSYMTDRDQQLRHPGDLFASDVAGIERPYTFPDF